MNIVRKSASTTAFALLAAGLLAGCSSTEHTEQTHFDFQSTKLKVHNSNANMPVDVVAGPSGEVSVSVTTTSAGKQATTPAWTLTGAELELGSPCNKGYIGMCEGSYTVVVPAGTSVTVNGVPAPVD
ncbi:hypothetical protein AAEX63_15275 [Luteococcus sp. H138]|uniref:hypothetical protein n=1 Tax=unclassified Luteococcus TaxID=2639923 RepID=UPI00313B15E9